MRHEIVPPSRSKPALRSQVVLVLAIALGAAAFVEFDAGRTWTAVAFAIPAAILGAFAAPRALEPFVIYLRR